MKKILFLTLLITSKLANATDRIKTEYVLQLTDFDVIIDVFKSVLVVLFAVLVFMAVWLAFSKQPK